MTSNNKKKNLNNMRLVVFFSLSVLLAACGGSKEQQAGNANTAQDTVPVFLLEQDTLKKMVELPAELVPYENAELFAKVQGFVKEMKVDLGDHVRKGQLLAIIEAPEINSRFAESEAALQSAKAKWTAGKDIYERLYRASQAKTPGIVAPVDLERSRSQMMADSATYAAAEKQSQAYKAVSGYLYIKSPFDGVITARKADPGALVGTNAMLLTVQNNRILRLRAAVPEMYISAATTSKNMAFRVDAYPTQQFKAALTRKSETIDPVTRTELWEFQVDNSSHELKAGGFAYVKIEITRIHPSYIVPASAIATTQEKKFVIRLRDGHLEWIDVRQGIINDKGVELFGDLQKDDTLLLKATDERKPGTSVYGKLVQTSFPAVR
ncbi:efflux RND transporter periplasmic adaptor subunit [Chitinophaga sancti]|uniref:efflux RND transporter periplasmic adaptor subunit n=1 Tax=Chitinophaga sancti TaxID=1004 RepID=UPI003F7A33E1